MAFKFIDAFYDTIMTLIGPEHGDAVFTYGTIAALMVASFFTIRMCLPKEVRG
jgi:hypothetical protein